MNFDTKEQKDIVLEMLSIMQIPGPKLELMYNFKQAVLAAKIEDTKAPKKDD